MGVAVGSGVGVGVAVGSGVGVGVGSAVGSAVGSKVSCGSLEFWTELPSAVQPAITSTAAMRRLAISTEIRCFIRFAPFGSRPMK